MVKVKLQGSSMLQKLCKIYFGRNEVDCTWIVTDVHVGTGILNKREYDQRALRKRDIRLRFKRSGKFITCHMKSFAEEWSLKIFPLFLPFLQTHTHTDILQSDI